MNLRVLPEARLDLIDCYGFYEERETGLGEDFLRSLFDDIDSLKIYAGHHAVLFGKHRKIASKFPHSIYYTIENSVVLIYAVIHDRRDPVWVAERLK